LLLLLLVPHLLLLLPLQASDWLDGFLARRLGHTSKLGSYLDPLADKVFVATAVGTMGALDMVPGWLAVLVVGRDSAQVVGMFWYRLRMFGGAWPGASAFFDVDHAVQTSTPSSNTCSSSSSGSSDSRAAGTSTNSSSRSSFSAGSDSSVGETAEDSSRSSVPMGVHTSGSEQEADSYEAHQSSSSSSSHSGSASDASSQQPATAGQLPMIRPLFISKANTALILALVAACMGHQWQGFPDKEVLEALEVVAASTTAVSAAAYARLHWQGRLLAPTAKADKQ
jgi:hypothetical protein